MVIPKAYCVHAFNAVPWKMTCSFMIPNLEFDAYSSHIYCMLQCRNINFIASYMNYDIEYNSQNI